MKTRKTNLLILGIIALLSLTNILYQLFASNTKYINFLSILLSIIGILSLILFLKDNKKYSLLTFIWAYSQTVIFTKYVPDFDLKQLVEAPIWNLNQNKILDLNIAFGMNFQTHGNNSYALNFNFLSLLFIFLAQIIYSNSIIGSKINLKSFKKESILNSILPAQATIKDKLTIGKEKKWFVISFGEENSLKYALIKTKGGERLKPNKKNQMLLMHYFEDGEKLKETNPKFNLKESDWAVIN